MKLFTSTLVAAAVAGAMPLAHAESAHSFSGNVALTTDYMYRGITQSNEGPAIQGGFDYSHASGFYAGIWASSLEFNPDTADNAASIEVDFYGGIAGEFANGISWDVGGLYYLYPDTNEDNSADYNFFELYGSLGYSFTETVSTGIYLAYSPDFYGEDDTGIYVAGSLDLALPQGFGASFMIGHQDVSGDQTSGPDGFDYTHWSIGVSKEVGIFGFDLTYYDMFNADEDCGSDTDVCDGVVFTVSSSW